MNLEELGKASEDLTARLRATRENLRDTGETEEKKLIEKDQTAKKLAAIMDLLAKRKEEEAFELFAPELAAELKVLRDKKALLINTMQDMQIQQNGLGLALQNEDIKLRRIEIMVRAKEQGINLE